MTTKTGISQSVTNFLDSVENEPAVLIGTGRIGISESLTEREDVHLVDSLSEVHNSRKNVRHDEYLVIDSLYRTYIEYTQSSNEEYRNTFEEILESGRLSSGEPIGVVLRPRSYQYLYSESESKNKVVESIYEWVLHFAEISKKDAIEIGTSLTDQDPKTVEDHMPDLNFKYEIKTSSSKEVYQTYIPHLLLDLSKSSDDYLPPGQLINKSSNAKQNLIGTITDFGKDLFKRNSLKKIQQSSKNVFSEIQKIDKESVEELFSDVDYESIPDDVSTYLSQIDMGDASDAALKSIGSAVPGAYPVLLLVLYYTNQESDQIAAFDQFKQNSQLLFGDGVPEPTQELVEEHLQMEPYTLESAKSLASEETVAKIRTLQTGLMRTEHQYEELSENISKMSNEFSKVNNQIQDITNNLNTLRQQFNQLQSRLSEVAVKYPEILDYKLQNSLRELGSLEKELLEQEFRYLGRTEREDWKISDLPFDRRLQQETLNKLETNQLIILRGPLGSGKTTTAFRSLSVLERSGAYVALANFEESEYAYIRKALETIDTRPCYLFVSYRLGSPAIDTSTQLRNLFKLVRDDLCDKIIIECRDEVYQNLLNQGGDVIQGQRGLSEIWRSKETVQCGKVSRQVLQDTVKWVYDCHGIEEDKIGNRFSSPDDIIAKFGNNPEFVKVASRLSAQGESLTDIETIGELIELDVLSLLRNFEDTKEFYRESIELLSLTRGLPLNCIEDITNNQIRKSEMVNLKNDLGGYVEFPEDSVKIEPSKLIPDIYTDILFQHWFLESNNQEYLLSHVEELLDKGYDDLLPDILLNISLAHSRYGSESGDHREQATKITIDVLNRLENRGSADNYFQSFSNLGDIPVPAAEIGWIILESNLSKSYLESLWEKRVYSEEVIGGLSEVSIDIVDSIGQLLASHIRKDSFEEVKTIYSEAGKLFFGSGSSFEWSHDSMSHLPADLLTYSLMEASRHTTQLLDTDHTDSGIEVLFDLFEDLNQRQQVHAEAAARLFSTPFLEVSNKGGSGRIFELLDYLLTKIEPHILKISEYSNLFEVHGDVDWSGPTSIFLRRFYLEITLLTNTTSDRINYKKWIKLVWENIEKTLKYCEQPTKSLFATARTILTGSAIRQEMVLSSGCNIVKINCQVIVEKLDPNPLPYTDWLFTQWFTKHPDSWYARLFELSFIDIIGQEQSRSFGDDLMYRIAGESKPERENLVNMMGNVVNQVTTVSNTCENPDEFEHEVFYAWYRALCSTGNPSQFRPYLPPLNKEANQVLGYNAKNYLCLRVASDDETQNYAGGSIDPFGQLPFDTLSIKTTTNLLTWIETFLQDDDVLFTASQFIKKQYPERATKEFERVFSELLGILFMSEHGTGYPMRANGPSSEEIISIYSKSEYLVENTRVFLEKSDIADKLSREMRMNMELIANPSLYD